MMMKKAAILFLLAGAMACSAAPEENGSAANTAADNSALANVAANDPPVQLAGADGYATAVTCYGRMYGTARLYGALQSAPPSGIDPAQMATMAEAQQIAAANFMASAHRLGAEIGRSESEIGAALEAAEHEVNVEHDRREFLEFSDWLLGEAERCAAIGAAQS